MKAIVGAAALAVASCSTGPLPTSSTADFDPLAFFAGSSQGEGEIRQLLSSPKPLRVRSFGERRGANTLVLRQTISEGRKSRQRVWVMRRVAPGRFTGALTDAEGRVSVTVRGPRAEIRYRIKGGLLVEQQLALQADALTLCNRLEVRKFGVRVALVRERITKATRAAVRPVATCM